MLLLLAICSLHRVLGAGFEPLTHVASKWSFLGVICSLQGVISSSWKVLQPLQCLAGHLLAMALLQQITCKQFEHPVTSKSQVNYLQRLCMALEAIITLAISDIPYTHDIWHICNGLLAV